MKVNSNQDHCLTYAPSISSAVNMLRIVGVYILTLPVVLLGCWLVFYLPLNAAAILPVLAIGWLIIVALCASVADRNFVVILLFLILFLILGHALTSAILLERIENIGSVNFDSDDAYYLDIAQAARISIREAPWSVKKHWDSLSHSERGLVPLSLRGYPFAITYMLAWLPDNIYLQYIATVSLNLLLFSLLFITVVYATQLIHGRLRITPLAIIFVLLCLNMFYIIAQCRKDILGVFLLFIACMCLAPRLIDNGKIQIKTTILLAICIIALLAIRTVYIVLPVMMIVFLHLGRMRRIPIKYILFTCLISLIIFMYFYSEGFQVRGVDLLSWHYGQNYGVLKSGGLASRVYVIPVLGPIAYFIFTPFPYFDYRAISTVGMIRNIGFLSFAFIFILLIVVKFSVIWSNRILRSAWLLMVVFLIMTEIGATLLEDADPRYRSPILPFMCIFAYSGLVATNKSRTLFSKSKRCGLPLTS